VLNPALKTEDFLEFREETSTKGRLVVLNPTNEDEDFSERWDDDRASYENFVDWMKGLSQAWSDLRAVEDITEAKERMSNLFGEDLTSEVIQDQAEFVRNAQSNGALSVGANGAITSERDRSESNGSRVRRNTYYGE
jgi:hypothetical protein